VYRGIGNLQRGPMPITVKLWLGQVAVTIGVIVAARTIWG